jgi:hypothetical protein
MAYAMVITHFLTSATPIDMSARSLLDRIAGWSRLPDWSADERVLLRMNNLLDAAKILIPEHTH